MKLINHLPMCWRESSETVSLVNAMQAEIDKLYDAYSAFYEEMYAASADLSIEKWERMCGISSIPSMSIQDRRAVVLSMIRGCGTCTKQRLCDLAQSFECGNIEIAEDAENYTVQITFVSFLGIPARIDEFKRKIREAVPAHLLVDYKYTYRRWGELSDKKWGELSAYTWDEVRSMEEIV